MAKPYSDRAQRRINAQIRAAESGRFDRRTLADQDADVLAIWVGRATETVEAGSLATFMLQRPNGNKGSEEDDAGQEVEAYVRGGTVYQDYLYRLVEVCGGDDARLEVIETNLPIVLGVALETVLPDGISADFTIGGETISVAVDAGIVIAGHVYLTTTVVGTDGGELRQVLDPTKIFIGKTTETVAQGDSGEVELYTPASPGGGDDYVATGITLEVYNRLQNSIASGKWVQCHYIDSNAASTTLLQWEMIGKIEAGGGGGSNPNLTGNADAFINFDDGSGTFTTSDGTKTATISRGLCLDGKDYGLIWAEDHHYAVVDPELQITVVPTALTKYGNGATCTVYAGTTGAETTTSETITAWVRKGLVFSGKKYRAVWKDEGWEIADPSLEFVAQAAADIDIGDTVSSQLIFTGSVGSETSSGTSTSVYNRYGNILQDAWVRCQWIDSAGTFEYVNAVCNP